MATTLALGDVVRLRVASYTANQQGINVIHYRVSTSNGSGQTDLQVATAIDSNLESRYKAVLSVAARYRGVSVQKIRPLPVAFPQVVVANDGVGTVAGDMLATQVSGIVTSITNLAGPKYRGRVYIPFPGEGSSDANGIPTNAYVGNIDDIGDELFSPLSIGVAPNDIVLQPVIFHRATNTFTDITGWVSRQKWATQRRRGSYGKTNPTPF